MVLNLVISGIPSILGDSELVIKYWSNVLNLVISGIPSIHSREERLDLKGNFCFKPCYKWNTFNTLNSYI